MSAYILMIFLDVKKGLVADRYMGDRVDKPYTKNELEIFDFLETVYLFTSVKQT